MAHNIAMVGNTAQAWYADKPAWHGLGTVTPGSKTAKQVIKQVPLFRRRVELVPVYVKVHGKFVEATEFRATLRAGDEQPLATGLTPDYTVMQDSDGLLTMEAFVAASRRASFVTAFGLGNGSRCAASIDLSRVLDLRIKRDPSRQESHLFGTWAHDGTGALRIGLWNNRVECQNMLNMALASSEGKGLLVSIRHTGDMEERLKEAQKVLGFSEKVVRAHVEEMNALAETTLPKGYVDPFLEEVVPIPQDMERPRSREEARNVIRGLYANSKTLVGVPTSPYRLYQAVAEYADHWRPLRINSEADMDIVSERRFRAITEGPSADLKERALALLRQEFLQPVLAKNGEKP
jgi:phage/plasmid-like protein (TIGR03299 family)